MGCLFATTKNAESDKYTQSTCPIAESRKAINANCARKENYRPTSIMSKDKQKTTNDESDVKNLKLGLSQGYQVFLNTRKRFMAFTTLID